MGFFKPVLPADPAEADKKIEAIMSDCYQAGVEFNDTLNSVEREDIFPVRPEGSKKPKAELVKFATDVANKAKKINEKAQSFLSLIKPY